jgi:hypothetical protein
MVERTHYDVYRSLRQVVFRQLDKNSSLSLKTQMEKLRRETVFVNPNKGTVKNYRSQWRHEYSRNGRAPLHHAGRGFLEKAFDAGLWEVAPCYGWRVSKNVNRERWRYANGVSFGWSQNGTVDVRFKGSISRGHLLSAFSRAFWDVLRSFGKPERETADHLKVLFDEKFHITERTITVDTGQPLPRTIIDRRRSHGEIIKLGDGSHPTSVEIEETEPIWLDKWTKTVDKFGLEIQSHLDLIKTWKEQNDAQNQKRDDPFDDCDVLRVSELVPPDKGWCVRCHRKTDLPYLAECADAWGPICRSCSQALREKMNPRGKALE